MARMEAGFSAIAIGSAGRGIGGTAKAKDTNGDLGLLHTNEDIELFKTWCLRNDVVWYGSLEVSGRVGSKAMAVQTLHEFFDSCQQQERAPIIYYTGHGDKNGDWCFPGYERVSFDDVETYHHTHSSGYVVTVFTDCCYSGQWVVQSRRKTKMIVKSASGPLKEAWNKVFSEAVFQGNTKAMRTLQSRGATQTYYDGKTCNVRDISSIYVSPTCICCERDAVNDGFMCYDGENCGYNQCQHFTDGVRCIKPIGENGDPGRYLECVDHR